MEEKAMIVKLTAFYRPCSGRIGTHLLLRKFAQIRNSKVSLLFALIYFNNVVNARSLSSASNSIFYVTICVLITEMHGMLNWYSILQIIKS